jgi:hypothetical protein
MPCRRESRLGQEFLDVSITQGEAEIQPDRVLNELGRKAMAAVAERSHADILSDTPLAPDPVFVTMPGRVRPCKLGLLHSLYDTCSDGATPNNVAYRASKHL